MAYRRLRRSRRGYKTKRATSKRRLYKRIRKMKRFAKPDGNHYEKFVVTRDLVSIGAGTGAKLVKLPIALNCNRTPPQADMVHMGLAPEYSWTASTYEMMKVRGVKIKFHPVDNGNAAGARVIRSMEAGTYPNARTTDYIDLNYPTSQELVQRLDYKIQYGQLIYFKRYFNMSRMRKTCFADPGINANGWMCTFNEQEAEKYVDQGVTFVYLNTYGFAANDYIGKIEIKYYVEFKDKRPIAL